MVVWLSVRADNKRAIKFYQKMEFELMGDISWKQGEIKGVIFRLDGFNFIFRFERGNLFFFG